jgi:hypothetical protein
VRTSPRSALAAAAVIALVVGAVGGFAYGRSSAPKHSTVQTASAPRPEAGNTASPPSPAVSKGFGAVSAGGASVASIGDGKMTRIFDRTTSEGVAIHVFTVETNTAGGVTSFGNCAPNTTCTETLKPSGAIAEPSCGATNWCAPPECYSAGITIEASNAGAVTQSGAPSYPLSDVAAVTSTVTFGQAEGSPAIGWAVKTGDQVATVRGTWTDGFVDSMAPQSGWAVVMHNGDVQTATIDVTDAGGNILKTFSVDQNTYAQTPSRCIPPPPAPPALPPAGEQPDDPAAAKDAITNAYQTVFTHGSDATLNQSLMEDPESLRDALDTTKSNFPQAVDTVTVTVGDIVFTSKTEAALYFELDYTGGALFGKQIGYAKLIDGTWKISHDTMCMVLSWGGGQCSGSSSATGTGVVVPPGGPVTTVPNN